jgi:hypothetical protein
MKTTLLIISACFSFIKCENKQPESKILEIYTNEDIYFVDVEKLRVANEVNDTIKAFDSFTELNEYISIQTAQDVNP